MPSFLVLLVTYHWMTAAEGTSSAPSSLPNKSSISVGPNVQTMEQLPQKPVQVEQQQQQHNSSQISHQEADKEADHLADDFVADHAVAIEEQKVLAILLTAAVHAVP